MFLSMRRPCPLSFPIQIADPISSTPGNEARDWPTLDDLFVFFRSSSRSLPPEEQFDPAFRCALLAGCLIDYRPIGPLSLTRFSLHCPFAAEVVAPRMTPLIPSQAIVDYTGFACVRALSNERNTCTTFGLAGM